MPQDLRPPLASIFDTFGVPATVTAPGGSPIATTVVWTSAPPELAPMDEAFQRVDARRLLSLRRDQVPNVPRGTAIVAPELKDGPDRTWLVDGFARIDAEELRVIVLPGGQDS